MKIPTKQITIVKSLVVNSRGEVLFVKRNWIERPEVHGKWELPGGKLEFGEQPEHTAKREAKEESGYDVRVKKVVPKVLSFSKRIKDLNHQLTLLCYLCELVGGEASLKDHGVSEVRWFKLNEVPHKSECLQGTKEFLEVYSASR